MYSIKALHKQNHGLNITLKHNVENKIYRVTEKHNEF